MPARQAPTVGLSISPNSVAEGSAVTVTIRDGYGTSGTDGGNDSGGGQPPPPPDLTPRFPADASIVGQSYTQYVPVETVTLPAATPRSAIR